MDNQSVITEFLTLQEIILHARRTLPAEVWDFIMGGGESEATLKRNRHALDCLGFRSQTFTDVSSVDASGCVLGHACALPVVLAPMGSISLIDEHGALAAADAAAKFGVVSFMSSVADPGPEKLIEGSSCPLVYTLFIQGDDDWLKTQVNRACELGFKAIAVLADTAYYSRRDRDVMNKLGSKVEPATTYANIQRTLRGRPASERAVHPMLYPATVTWETFESVKRLSTVPVIAKGISSATSARQALDHGADAIYVSNHGGRQLDHQPSSVDMLVEVVDAIGGEAEILVDGGCMRGADIVKFIALGATAVGIGKLQALALGAGGAAALHRALEILEEEVVVNLGLMGVTRFSDLTPNNLRALPALGSDHPLAPFPVVMEQLGLR